MVYKNEPILQLIVRKSLVIFSYFNLFGWDYNSLPTDPPFCLEFSLSGSQAKVLTAGV